jgi:uncharacterized protein YggU (UPF0235/DUF167 family)
MIEIVATDGGVRFAVKASPGARRDRIVGEYGGALKVCVRQPPERGRANAAIRALLAAALGVRRADVRIVGGPASSAKLVQAAGLTVQQARRRLAAASGR